MLSSFREVIWRFSLRQYSGIQTVSVKKAGLMMMMSTKNKSRVLLTKICFISIDSLWFSISFQCHWIFSTHSDSIGFITCFLCFIPTIDVRYYIVVKLHFLKAVTDEDSFSSLWEHYCLKSLFFMDKPNSCTASCISFSHKN